MEYWKCQVVSPQGGPGYNEKWLQQQITTDVEIVGLGAELTVRDVERRQRGAGRLDLRADEVTKGCDRGTDRPSDPGLEPRRRRLRRVEHAGRRPEPDRRPDPGPAEERPAGRAVPRRELRPGAPGSARAVAGARSRRAARDRPAAVRAGGGRAVSHQARGVRQGRPGLRRGPDGAADGRHRGLPAPRPAVLRSRESR